MSDRVQDFALLIGHAWRCTNCRDALLGNPEATWVGYKLSEDQRERIRKLTNESFQTMMSLVEVTGLSARELEAAVEHPRARLRHLGSYRGDYFFRTDNN